MSVRTCVILVCVVGGIGFTFDYLGATGGVFSGGIAGVMGLITALWWSSEKKTKRLEKTWIAAQGKVTSFRTGLAPANAPQEGYTAQRQYAAVVTVHTAQGDTEIIDHKWQKTIPQIGELREVRLNPENVLEGFVYYNEKSLLTIPLMISLGGVLGWILIRCIPDNFFSCLFPAPVWKNPGLRFLYLIGWGWLVLGILALQDAWRFFRRASFVEGKVISFKTRENTNSRNGRIYKVYAEVISFPYENGTREWCSNVWKYHEPTIGAVRKIGIRRPDMKNLLQTSSPSLSTDTMQQGKSSQKEENFRIYSPFPYIVGSVLVLLGLIVLVVLWNIK